MAPHSPEDTACAILFLDCVRPLRLQSKSEVYVVVVIKLFNLRDGGPLPVGRSPGPPYLQRFNTAVTEMLRALRVKVLTATEYTEAAARDDTQRNSPNFGVNKANKLL